MTSVYNPALAYPEAFDGSSNSYADFQGFRFLAFVVLRH